MLVGNQESIVLNLLVYVLTQHSRFFSQCNNIGNLFVISRQLISAEACNISLRWFITLFGGSIGYARLVKSCSCWARGDMYVVCIDAAHSSLSITIFTKTYVLTRAIKILEKPAAAERNLPDPLVPLPRDRSLGYRDLNGINLNPNRDLILWPSPQNKFDNLAGSP